MENKSFTVLIIDDDANMRRTLGDILELKGFGLLSSGTGREALEFIGREDIAVALIDLRLTDMRGLDVMHRIKTKSPDTECILLTGHASQDTAIEAINLGAYSYVQKPFNLEQLLVTIQRAAEKRAADRKLRENEERFRSLYENATVGIYRTTPDGRILFANPALVKMLGFDSFEELSRRNLEQEGYQSAYPRQDFKRLLEEENSVRGIQDTWRRKDGSEVHVRESAYVIRDDDGAALYYEGIVEDVTEQVRTEDQLRKLSRAVEQSSASIVITDPEGTIEYVNPHFSALTGYSFTEAVGKNPSILKSGLTPLEEYQRLWMTIKSGQEWRGEFCNRKKNGDMYWEAISISPVFDHAGKITHFVAVKDDVTERKRTEEQTRRRVVELEVLYENGLAINNLLDPRQVAQKNIEILEKKLNWKHAVIRSYDRQTGRMEILAFNRPDLTEETRSAHLATMEANVQKPGQGLSGWVIQHGESVRCDNVEQDARYITSFAGVRSGLYVPMKAGYQIIGAICVESTLPADFSEADQRLLETLAAQTAAAIEKARLYQETIRASERSAVVARAGQEIATAGLDLEKLYQSVHQATAELIPLDFISIILADYDHKSLNIVYLFDKGKRYPSMSINWGDGISGYVIRERKLLLINDYHREHPAEMHVLGDLSPARSMLFVPLFSGDKPIGVLSAQNYQPDIYTKDDISLLSVLANFVATAIENAKLYHQLNRHLEELDTLIHVSSVLRSAITVDDIYSAILKMVMDLVKAEGAGLAIYEPTTGHNNIVAVCGAFRPYPGMRVPHGKGGTWEVIRTGKSYLTSNVRTDEHIYNLDPVAAIQSMAFIPLIAQEKIIGVLAVGRREDISESAMGLLSAIADIAANAIRRSTLYEQTVQYAEQLKTVNEIGRMLSETLEPDQIYVRLIGAIYNLLPNISGLIVSLYDTNSKTITYAAAHVDGTFINVKSLLPMPLDPAGKNRQSQVLLNGEPLIVKDLASSLGRQPTATFGVGPRRVPDSALYVPMFSKGATIGLLQVQSYQPDRFHQEDINLLSLAANTAAGAIENARLFAETQSRLRFVSALHAIDVVISASVDLRVTMGVILEKSISELGVDAAAVALVNPHTQVLEFISGRGFLSTGVEGMQIKIGEALAGRAVVERRIIKITRSQDTEAENEKENWNNLNLFPEEKFQIEFAIPLISKGQVQGALQICHRSELRTTQEWSYFFDTLAGEAAIAIENARLFADLQRSNVELSLAYDSTIEGWSRALDLRDKETEGHTQRVTEFTERLARAMGIRETELVHIRRGALLHDIGKMGVPDQILFKPDKLTDEEWVIMRKHPQLAYDMLLPISYLRPALDIPYCHHEKWDGSGYPRGLRGEEIPIAARLFAVVDVWDALTSDRPYGKRWPEEKVAEYIHSLSGKQFDPVIVDLFFKIKEETDKGKS